MEMKDKVLSDTHAEGADDTLGKLEGDIDILGLLLAVEQPQVLQPQQASKTVRPCTASKTPSSSTQNNNGSVSTSAQVLSPSPIAADTERKDKVLSETQAEGADDTLGAPDGTADNDGAAETFLQPQHASKTVKVVPVASTVPSSAHTFNGSASTSAQV